MASDVPDIAPGREMLYALLDCPATDINERLRATPVELSQRFRRSHRLVGLTKGNFYLIELIRALLAKTGPVHLVISTWTFGVKDVEIVARLLDTKQVESVCFVLDTAFARSDRTRELYHRFVALFGTRSAVCTTNHAKFFLMHNDAWHIVGLTSMNMNNNPRIEHFSIEDNKALCGSLLRFVDRLFDLQPNRLEATAEERNDAFRQLFGRRESGVDDDAWLDDLMQKDPLAGLL